MYTFIAILLLIILFYFGGIYAQKLQEKKEWEAKKRDIQQQEFELFSSRRNRIFIKTTIPLLLHEGEVYYYEKRVDPQMRELLVSTVDSLRSSLNRRIHYCQYEDHKARWEEFLKYNRPDLLGEQSLTVKLPDSIAELIDPYVVNPVSEELSNGLFRVIFDLTEDEEGNSVPQPRKISLDGEEVYECSYCELRPSMHYGSEEIIKWYFTHIGLSDQAIRYSLVKDPFREEMERLLLEVRERMERLRQMGVDEMVLRQLSLPEVHLSPLIITDKHQILLPDYDNMEIKMEPINKAVYLLFLRHPEGILFKHLSDYREELMQIYAQVSNRCDKEKMEKSINDILDPTKNSINEKCARIREAFVREFSDEIAKNYYINGPYAEPKSITIASQEGMVQFLNKANL